MIAKYRKPEYPGEWFLTDFTMQQVEVRLEKAEAERDSLNNRITQLEEWLVEAFNNNDTERVAKEKAEAELAKYKALYESGQRCQCSDDEACAHVRRAEKAEAERGRLREFVTKVSKQGIPKPDYWSDCWQCEWNKEDTEELLEEKP